MIDENQIRLRAIWKKIYLGVDMPRITVYNEIKK